MARYRIEATCEAATGLYCAKLFYPAESEEPVAGTLAVYASEAEARQQMQERFQMLAGDQPEGTSDSLPRAVPQPVA